MNTLILKSDSKSYFFQYLNDKNIFSFYFINNGQKKFFIKILRKIGLDYIFFDNWKKNIKKYNQVIIFDTGFKSSISKYIKRKNKKCKIILYYWNVVDIYNKCFLTDCNINEFWTFDETDAIKYNMKFNPQFYSSNIKNDFDTEKKSVIFLGRNKNRKKVIDNIDMLLSNYNIEHNFIIIEKEKDLLPYSDYLKLLSNNNTILDIIDCEHTGLTLRCLEALFFNKKLITNNSNIKNYNFYNKRNIFILNEDNPDNLIEFLNSDYEKISDDIRDYYDYEEWLRRMIDERSN